MEEGEGEEVAVDSVAAEGEAGIVGVAEGVAIEVAEGGVEREDITAAVVVADMQEVQGRAGELVRVELDPGEVRGRARERDRVAGREVDLTLVSDLVRVSAREVGRESAGRVVLAASEELAAPDVPVELVGLVASAEPGGLASGALAAWEVLEASDARVASVALDVPAAWVASEVLDGREALEVLGARVGSVALVASAEFDRDIFRRMDTTGTGIMGTGMAMVMPDCGTEPGSDMDMVMVTGEAGGVAAWRGG